MPFKLFISGSSYYNDDPINNIPLLFSDEWIERFKENKNIVGILGIILGFTLMMSLDLLL